MNVDDVTAGRKDEETSGKGSEGSESGRSSATDQAKKREQEMEESGEENPA